MMTPAAFRKKHDIDVRVHSEVVSIDREKKTVTVRSTETGETYEQPYDKLVLSPGANPIVPPALKGADREMCSPSASPRHRRAQDISG